MITFSNQATQKEIARVLLYSGAVRFGNFTFKSGLPSPVYVDNRVLPFFPIHWKKVINGFSGLIKENALRPEIIAGIEAGGISHASVLAYVMGIPSGFVRKEKKDHGTGQMFESGDIKGKNLLLLEDLISTGESSLKNVTVLRQEGAIVNNCTAIMTYEFPKAAENFKNAEVNLSCLTSFRVVLEEAIAMNAITPEQLDELKKWHANPKDWQPKA